MGSCFAEGLAGLAGPGWLSVSSEEADGLQRAGEAGRCQRKARRWRPRVAGSFQQVGAVSGTTRADVEGEALLESEQGAEQRATEDGKDEGIADTSQEVPAEAREQVVVPVAAEGFGDADAGLVGHIGAADPERPCPEVGDGAVEQAPCRAEKDDGGNLRAAGEARTPD